MCSQTCRLKLFTEQKKLIRIVFIIHIPWHFLLPIIQTIKTQMWNILLGILWREDSTHLNLEHINIQLRFCYILNAMTSHSFYFSSQLMVSNSYGCLTITISAIHELNSDMITKLKKCCYYNIHTVICDNIFIPRTLSF